MRFYVPFLGRSIFAFITPPPRRYEHCWGRHRTTLGGVHPGKVILGSLLSPALSSPQAKGNVVGGLEEIKETTLKCVTKGQWGSGEGWSSGLAWKVWTTRWFLNQLCAQVPSGFCFVFFFQPMMSG